MTFYCNKDKIENPISVKSHFNIMFPLFPPISITDHQTQQNHDFHHLQSCLHLRSPSYCVHLRDPGPDTSTSPKEEEGAE